MISQASFNNPNVSVSNCFSTTYENYLVVVNWYVNGSGTTRPTFWQWLDSSGNSYAFGNYGVAFGYDNSSTTLYKVNSANTAQINLPDAPTGGAQTAYAIFQIARPSATNGEYSNFTGTMWVGQNMQRAYTIGGYHESSGGNTIYGFKFYNGTYNLAGNYRVYGYQKS